MGTEIANVQVIFAEDIREEASGQFSIIGVFQDTIEASAFPVELPKLSLMVLMSTLIEAPAIIKEFRLFCKRRDEEETFLSQTLPNELIDMQRKASEQSKPGSTWANLHMKIGSHRLSFSEEAQVMVELTSISGKKYKSNALSIKGADSQETPSIRIN